MHLHPHLPLLQPPGFPPTRVLPLRQDSMMEHRNMIAHFLALKQNARVSALQLPRTLIRIPTLAHMVLHLQNGR